MVSDWEMLTHIVFVLIKLAKTSNKRAFTRYFKKLLVFCLISFFVYTVYFIPGFCLRGDCNFMGGLLCCFFESFPEGPQSQLVILC